MGSVEEIQLSILHINVDLLGKLQRVLGVLYLGPEEVDEKLHQRLHQIGHEYHRLVVTHVCVRPYRCVSMVAHNGDNFKESILTMCAQG